MLSRQLWSKPPASLKEEGKRIHKRSKGPQRQSRSLWDAAALCRHWGPGLGPRAGCRCWPCSLSWALCQGHTERGSREMETSECQLRSRCFQVTCWLLV